MNGIQRMFALLEYRVLWRSIFQVTLVRLWLKEDNLMSLTQIVTNIWYTKNITFAPWQDAWLPVSKSLQYYQGMYRKIEAMVQDIPQTKTFQSKGHHLTVSLKELSEQWQIGLKQARSTLSKITQIITILAVMPLAIRYKAEWVFWGNYLRAWGPQILWTVESIQYMTNNTPRCFSTGHTLLKFTQWLRNMMLDKHWRSL